MGLNIYDFDKHVEQIIKRHKTDILESDISTRESKNSKYLSVTIMVEFESREQADLVYMDLSSDERVLMAL